MKVTLVVVVTIKFSMTVLFIVLVGVVVTTVVWKQVDVMVSWMMFVMVCFGRGQHPGQSDELVVSDRGQSRDKARIAIGISSSQPRMLRIYNVATIGIPSLLSSMLFRCHW